MKNKVLTFLLLLPLFSFSQGTFTGMKNPSLFKKKLNETTKNTTTLQSSFSQEKNLSVLSEKITSKGKFYFRKERMLRWEYTNPFTYCVIMNNDQVYIKDESKENRFDARSNRMFREINGIIIGCICGTILNDEKNFRIQLQESNDLNLVTLFPKNPQLHDFLSEIRIYFDRLTFTVSILEMIESSGDNTRIEFKEIKTNLPLQDDIFQVK
jgi:outer membrane lipoprotein-sorting protein